MITVLTDDIELWFKYIWDQFIQINSLKSGYELVQYSDFKHSKHVNYSLIIEYGSRQQFLNSLFIPKRKAHLTDDYVWIRKDLPVYRATVVGGDNGSFDIFWNAFVHLSRLEEWESEKNGNPIHSYSFRHPRKDKRIWKIPVVNYLFNELEEKIRQRFPEVSFGEKAKPIIELSHDVDYIHKTIQLRIKQSLFHLFNSGKFLLRMDIKNSLLKFKNGVEFALTDSDYWCFDDWRELESKMGIRSVYYFFSKADNQTCNPKQWLLDPSYDISNNMQLKKKCMELASEGYQLGIHGSYFSAENEELFLREKELMERATGINIKKSRQHWLNYYECKTPYIHTKAGIEEDSTIGFNDIAGFRSGVASLYNPYDHKSNAPFPFKEIPLVVMDSHLYDYSDRSDNLRWLFDSIHKVKNFSISVDWHQRVISNDYGWGKGLEQFMTYSRDDLDNNE